MGKRMPLTGPILECDWESFQPPQSQVMTPHERPWLEGQTSQPAEQRLKGYLTFDARQRRAKTEMGSPAKS